MLASWKAKKAGADRLLQNVTEKFKINILNRKPIHVPTWTHELKEKPQHVPQFFPHEMKNMGPKGKPMKRVIEEEPLEEVPNKRPKDSWATLFDVVCFISELNSRTRFPIY